MLTPIQVQRLSKVIDRHQGHRLYKYRHWRSACRLADVHARLLGLHAMSRRLRVLDLGGGLSYFAAVCQHYGHKAITLDLDDSLPREAAEALDIEYRGHMIVAGIPLPGSDTFDLITARRLNMTEPNRWTWDEYATFAEEVLARLGPNGRWFMVPNHGANVDFVLDCEHWREILAERVCATNPTHDSVLIEKR